MWCLSISSSLLFEKLNQSTCKCPRVISRVWVSSSLFYQGTCCQLRSGRKCFIMPWWFVGIMCAVKAGRRVPRQRSLCAFQCVPQVSPAKCAFTDCLSLLFPCCCTGWTIRRCQKQSVSQWKENGQTAACLFKSFYCPLWCRKKVPPQTRMSGGKLPILVLWAV